MSQSVSEARLIQYNSSLMELDLEIFKKGKKENQATISALQKQLDGAKIQMVSDCSIFLPLRSSLALHHK